MNQADYIGTAMSNPAQLIGGRAAIRSGEQVIKESVFDILGTSVGETLLECSYGSRLDEALFLPNDAVTWSLIKQMVLEALTTWEKRIQVLSVDVQEAENENIKCIISVNYRILATNKTGALVYPFYKTLP